MSIPVKFYNFFDADQGGGFIEYDINGEYLKELFDTCAKFCRLLSFRENDTSLPCSIEKFKVSTPFFTGTEYDYIRLYRSQPKTEVFYEICPELINSILSVKNSIFDFQDPIFYRDDLSMFFYSETHEGYCTLITRENENIDNIILNGRWTLSPKLGIVYPDDPFESVGEFEKHRTILKMLDKSNSPQVQAEGMHFAEEINAGDIVCFILHPPNAGAAENCAKILSGKDDDALNLCLEDLVQWLKDLTFPGADIIARRLENFQDKNTLRIVKNACLKEAHKTHDKVWENNIKKLIL